MDFIFKYWHTITSAIILTAILGVFGAMKLDIHLLNSKLETANQQLQLDKNAIEAQNASIKAFEDAQKERDTAVKMAEQQTKAIGDNLKTTLDYFRTIKVPQTCPEQIDYLRSFAPLLSHWPSSPVPQHP